MSRCTLTIGDRVVVDSRGGALDAEYALFDPGNIELQSDGPGTNREFGYRTNVGDAMRRLEEAGVTLALADEAAAAMQPVLAEAYARGAAAHRVASKLSACELFEGKTYDAAVKRYIGGWLDLSALAVDTKLVRAASAMQALHLVALLSEKSEATPVFLSTLEYTRTRRPGERSYKRIPLDHAAELPDALRALAAAAHSVNPDRASGAARTELLETVNARSAGCGDTKIRAHLASLARLLAVREPPPRGPLADPEIWAMEAQLSTGDATGVAERLDTLEKARGRLPATIYLRAKAALMTGAEPPKAIAERMSALSQSMPSFFELELVAAYAWLQAGDAKRAKAFARDLVENPNAPDELRVKALELLEGPSRPAGELMNPPSEPPTPPPQGKPKSRRSKPPSSKRPPKASSHPPPPGVDDDEEEAPDTSIDPTPIVAVHTDARAEAPDDTPQERTQVSPTNPPPGDAVSQPPTPRVPSVPPRPDAPRPYGRSEPPRAHPAPLSRPPRGARDKTLSSRSSQPPIEANRIVTIESPDIPAPPPPIVDVVTAQVVEEPRAPMTRRASERPPAFEGPQRHAPPPAALVTTSDGFFVRGASQPPFQTDVPPPMPSIPRTPSVPRERARTELAESLSLPPGLHGQPPPKDEIPTTVIDARIAFTWLSRELGRDYRTKHKVELRTDVASIESMQRHLRERFADGMLKTPEDAFELRRHGAFLTEILARQLGAYWADIGPSELGYWAMVVPTQTRIWPFGRILRFVTMGHKERDLVSYYLELESRARA